MLKKTTLAVLGMAISGFASAGSMGPICSPGNVTVPCEANRWEIGVQALYLKSIFDADKAYAQDSLGLFGQVKNDWDWGYRLEGAYHFNTGNDITIDWTHYKSNVRQRRLNGSVPLFAQVGATNIPYVLSDENRIDQVNLVMGQHADFGLVQKMRFYAGLQYANIQATAHNLYDFTVPLIVPSVGGTVPSLFDNSDYKGLGPVIGIDYSYDITPELSLTANGSGAILYGNSRFNTGVVVNPLGVVLQSVYASKKAIVPAFEAKLGLNYAYAMAQGVMNLEGGYQIMNYFNVLQSQRFQNILNPVGNSDYGLYGPYLGLKYVGNA